MDLIGTRFEEEEQTKKQNFYNQKAKDDKGRVRWQGAFTGGFVAGYHNTCGSKEGFEYQQFKSRDKYNANKTVFDYMDADDYGVIMLGENIVIREEYSQNMGIKTIGEEILNNVQLRQVEDFKDIGLHSKVEMEEKVTEQQEIKGFQSIFDNGKGYYFYKQEFMRQQGGEQRTKEQDKQKDKDNNRIYANLLYKDTDYYEDDPKIQYDFQINEMGRKQEKKKESEQEKNDRLLQKLTLKDMYVKGEMKKTEEKNTLKVPNDFDPFRNIKKKESKFTKEKKIDQQQINEQRQKKVDILSSFRSFVPAQTQEPIIGIKQEHQKEKVKTEKEIIQEERLKKIDDLKKVIEKSQNERTVKRFYVSEALSKKFNIKSPKDNIKIRIAEERIKESQRFMNKFDKEVLPLYQDQILKKVKDNNLLQQKFSTGEILNKAQMEVDQNMNEYKQGLQIMNKEP